MVKPGPEWADHRYHMSINGHGCSGLGVWGPRSRAGHFSGPWEHGLKWVPKSKTLCPPAGLLEHRCCVRTCSASLGGSSGGGQVGCSSPAGGPGEGLGAGGWAGLAGPEEPLTRDCVPRWFRGRLTEGLPALGFGSQQFLGVSLLN